MLLQKWTVSFNASLYLYNKKYQDHIRIIL